MPRKGRKIEIEIGGIWVENPVTYLPGVIGTATLLEDLAPKTCQALWDMLPIETRTIHVFRGGQGWRTEKNFALQPADAPIENRLEAATLLKPGDIVYYNNHKVPLLKIFMAYGNAAWPSEASLIARVDENLDELVNISRRILYEGPKNVTFRRKK